MSTQTKNKNSWRWLVAMALLLNIMTGCALFEPEPPQKVQSVEEFLSLKRPGQEKR